MPLKGKAHVMKNILWLIIGALFFSPISLQSWHPPKAIEGPFNNVEGVQIKLDNQGNAFALWIDFNGISRTVNTAYYNQQLNQWSDSSFLSLPNAHACKLAVSEVGQAMAVWERNDPILGTIKVEYAIYENGKWTFGKPISSFSLENETTPQVIINSQGYAVVVWQTESSIRAAVYDFDFSEWAEPVDISDTEITNQKKHIKIANNQEHLEVIWEWKNLKTLESKIQTIHYHDFIWEPIQDVITVSFPEAAYFPHIALSKEGIAYALWTNLKLKGNHYETTMEFSKKSENWTDSVSISEPIAASSLDTIPKGKIAVNESGKVLAIWDNTHIETSLFTVQARLNDNGQWRSKIETISTPSILVTSSELVMDAREGAIVVWVSHYPLGSYQLFSSTYNFVSWSSPILINEFTYSDAIEEMSIVMNKTGECQAIWSQGGPGWVFINTSITSVRPVTPSNFKGRVILNKFPFHQEYFYEFTWDPCPSSKIIAYHLFKDNKLLAKLNANTFVFVERNKNMKIQHTYTLIAENSDGLLSLPISITLP